MKWFFIKSFFILFCKIKLISNSNSFNQIDINSVEHAADLNVKDLKPVILNDNNVHELIKENELVFINFHAPWCPYSQLTNPIFEKAWIIVKKLYPNTKVIFGTLDCDSNGNACAHFNISKYPTLKIFRLGTPRSEYRGKRDPKDMSAFVSEQLDYRVRNLTTPQQLDSIPKDKSSLVVFVGTGKELGDLLYKTLHMIGFLMKDDCDIYVASGPASLGVLPAGQESKIVYKPAHLNQTEMYEGELGETDRLSQWMIRKCTPFIREINRENAEEITERRLPLLILFYDEKTLGSLKTFTDLVHEVLEPENYTDKVQPVFAKAEAFMHPLHHLGKTEADLPVLAIDSLAHMFAFPHPFKVFDPSPGHPSHVLLKRFVDDLFTEKLHKDHHQKMNAQFWQQVQAFQKSFNGAWLGGDDSPDHPAQPPGIEGGGAAGDNQIPSEKMINNDDPARRAVPPDGVYKQPPPSPPPSAFQKLQPSYTRYTLLRSSDHDEL